MTEYSPAKTGKYPPIAHFRVALSLSIKARPGAQPFNEFNLHVTEISFSYEKMGTKTGFEEEATGDSEMAYFQNCACCEKDIYLIYQARGPYWENIGPRS